MRQWCMIRLNANLVQEGGHVELRPVIASYSGRSYYAIREFLDGRALDVVARAAASPVEAGELDSGIRDELIEMHVLREQDGLVRLDTSVFLEDDIQKIAAAISQFSTELSALVIEAAAEMRNEPPAITNLLVGIIGIGQSLGRALRDEGIAADWKSYGGKYGQSKVDFDEICEAYAALGQDLQNKTVLRGTRYTAVLIGPGGASYQISSSDTVSSGVTADYVWQINVFLTDAYAMLIAGELDNGALRSAAEQVGLFREGRPDTLVLTNDTIGRYMPVIDRVGRITHSYFREKLGPIRDLLRTTTCGRQGVPVENMMLNLWRYIRKGIAREMYARGFFTDRARENGVVTIFYENTVKVLAELLG